MLLRNGINDCGKSLSQAQEFVRISLKRTKPALSARADNIIVEEMIIYLKDNSRNCDLLLKKRDLYPKLSQNWPKSKLIARIEN